MSLARQFIPVPLACAALLGTGVCVVRGGDKVDFSNQKGNVDLPSTHLKQQQQAKPFDFLDRSRFGHKATGPEVPPSLVPTTTLRGRQLQQLEQYIDQQRNWIFLSPDSLSKPTTPEQAFGVQDSAADGQSGKPKTALERYWQRAGHDSQSHSNKLSGDSARLHGNSSEPGDLSITPVGQDKTGSASSPGEALPNSLVDQLRPGAGLGRSSLGLGMDPSFAPNWALGSSLSPGLNPAGGPATSLTPAQFRAQDTAFRNSLLSPPGQNAAASVNGFLGSQAGSTPQAPNPAVTEPSGNSAGAFATFDHLPGANPIATLSLPGSFGNLPTPALGSSSLAPAIAAPGVAATFAQPKPLVLQVPRLHF
jgi:hypothetical protein